MPQVHADDAFLQDAAYQLHDQFDIDHVTLQVMRQVMRQAFSDSRIEIAN